MNQVIKQKFQSSNNELILRFVLGSSISSFDDYKKIINTQTNLFAITNDGIFEDLQSKINSFDNLQKNWDSYNADTISQIAIDTAIETLNHLHSKGLLTNGFTVNVFPMRDGGIQFEFDGKYLCAELEISPNGESTCILFDDEGGIVETEQIFELSEVPTLLEEAQYV